MGDEYTFRGNLETYRQFRGLSIIRERMIIATGLDSEDTEASAKCIRSGLLCASLRLEGTDKAVRRLPKNEPLKTSAGVCVIISLMRGKERADRGKRWKLRRVTHQLD
jgi:hypothetical protein